MPSTCRGCQVVSLSWAMTPLGRWGSGQSPSIPEAPWGCSFFFLRRGPRLFRCEIVTSLIHVFNGVIVSAETRVEEARVQVHPQHEEFHGKGRRRGTRSSGMHPISTSAHTWLGMIGLDRWRNRRRCVVEWSTAALEPHDGSTMTSHISSPPAGTHIN